MDDRQVRWGILGTARIARSRIVPGMIESSWCTPLAIASRDLAAARAFAGEFDIPRAYGSYQELLDDEDVEAVYIPLPNHLHVAYVEAAVARGKHVLCEKPMGISSAEVAALLPLGRDRFVSEAFMVRFHPQWELARALVRNGELGDVRALFCRLDYAVPDPRDIRNSVQPGGGALFDLGVYGIVAARYFLEAEPTCVFAYANGGATGQPDRNLSAVLDFGDNRHATLMHSSETVNNQRVEISGTQARLTLPFAIQPSPNKPACIEVERLDRNRIERTEIPPARQYANEVEAFARAVRGVAPLAYGVGDALANLKVVEALQRSIASGRWESL